jgi:hypothetical protein
MNKNTHSINSENSDLFILILNYLKYIQSNQKTNIMRKHRLLPSISAAIIIVAFLFTTACRKNKAAEDTGYAADHATSEQTFNDVQNISDQAADITAGSTLNFRTTATTIGGCATVTKTPGSIVIDFGATDCVCRDGRTRRGKIIVTYSGGGYKDVGSVHTITFDNFYQNDNKVTGTKTVTNMGYNAAGHLYFNVTVDGSVTRKSGGTVSASWTRVRTWTEGSATADISDDVYEITGSGTITRANGSVINITISKPLIVARNCDWIEAGSVTFALAGGQSRVLNFGDTPNCDDMATVTMANGKVKEITLP